MRQITKEAIRAFLNDADFHKSNTAVETYPTEEKHVRKAYLSLFGNDIARKINGHIEISLAGWNTPTTRERLNGLGQYLGFRITQKDFELYLNGQLINSYDWYQVA